MSGFYRARFLLSSFGPLFAIFALKLYYDAGVSGFATWVFAALFVISLITFIQIVLSLKGSNETTLSLSDIKSKDSDIFSYLTTYIPPLISRDMSKIEVYLPLIVLYTILIAAYMRLSSPYLNPYFILSGIRVHEGKETSTRNTVIILSRGAALDGSETLGLHEIGNGDLYYYDGAGRVIPSNGDRGEKGA